MKKMDRMTSKPPSPEALQHTIDRFWETIPPTWGSIRERIRGIVTEHLDLTVEQYHILRHIRKGVTSMSDLAAAKHISRPAISQLVDTLVSKGLILRRQSEGDRRCVELELTPNGMHLVNQVFQQNREWMGERLACLSEEELAQIAAGLDLLKKAFDDPKPMNDR
jgi:DNA-binding MarR family transcriptional regulator